MPFHPLKRIAERIRDRRERRRDLGGPEPVIPDPTPPVRPASLNWRQRIVLAILKRLFSAGPDAVKGFINVNEVWKSFGVSSLGGALVTLLIVILTTISANAAAIFSPTVAGLATIVLGIVLTQLHALTSGQHAVVTPAALVPTGEVLTPSSDPPPADVPVDQARASQPFQPPEVSPHPRRAGLTAGGADHPSPRS